METEMEHLLTKYISGEATAEEAEEIESWIAASPANKQAFMDVSNVFDLYSSKGNYQQPTVVEEWKKLHGKLQPTSPTGMPRKILPSIGIGAYIVAGLVLTGIVLYLVYRNPGTTPDKNIFAHYSGDSFFTETLPQGSKVFVDRHSRISYATGNNISVVGAAYFAAIAPPSKLQVGPMEIHPQYASLFVMYDSAEQSVSAHVQSGTAELNVDGQTISIKEGEAITYDGKKKRLEGKKKANINLFGYATKVFDFNDTPLKEAVHYLEKAYGITIVMDTALENCRITTRFDNKALTEILDIMAFTLNFKYEQASPNGPITLKGEGCE